MVGIHWLRKEPWKDSLLWVYLKPIFAQLWLSVVVVWIHSGVAVSTYSCHEGSQTYVSCLVPGLYHTRESRDIVWFLRVAWIHLGMIDCHIIQLACAIHDMKIIGSGVRNVEPHLSHPRQFWINSYANYVPFFHFTSLYARTLWMSLTVLTTLIY